MSLLMLCMFLLKLLLEVTVSSASLGSFNLKLKASESANKGLSELLSSVNDFQVVDVAVRQREGSKFSVYFKAYNEDFALVFEPLEMSIFRNVIARDMKIKTQNGYTKLHHLAYYVGVTTMTNHQAHGHFKTSGVFNGVVHFANKTDMLFVEPASEYFVGSKYQNQVVVYKLSQKSAKPPGIVTVLQRGRRSEAVDRSRASIKGHTRLGVKLVPNIGRHCRVSVFVDHLFFEHKGQSDYQIAVDEVLMYIIEVDRFFRSTDLFGDLRSSNLGFQIADVTVLERNDPSYHFGDDIKNITDLLYAFSKLSFNKACLALLFTHRKLDGNIGSSWVPTDPTDNKGLCGNQTSGSGDTLSLNTIAISTYAAQGQVFEALLHDFGHSFGAHHDDPSDRICSPGGENGNYIMREDGSEVVEFKPNQLKFSPCSLNMMQEFTWRRLDCFQADDPVCGNGVEEEGEECDCGLKSHCLAYEPWCVPYDGVHNIPGCSIRGVKGRKICHRSQEPCCTQDGHFVPAEVQKVCRDETECTHIGICNGNSSACPVLATYDGNPCHNGTGVCLDGACSHDRTYVKPVNGSRDNKDLSYQRYNSVRAPKANEVALIICLSCVFAFCFGIMLFLMCKSGKLDFLKCVKYDEERHTKICCYCYVMPRKTQSNADKDEYVPVNVSEENDAMTERKLGDIIEKSDSMKDVLKEVMKDVSFDGKEEHIWG